MTRSPRIQHPRVRRTTRAEQPQQMKLAALVPGTRLLDDLEYRAQVFEQITGKKVTPEEIERVRAKREARRKREAN